MKKQPDQKKMNTLFFLTELYLVIMSIVTIGYGFPRIAVYLLCLAVLATLIHFILYRHNCSIVVEKDSCGL